MAPHPVRRLGTLVEPLAAAVYFAPEAHKGYTELGCVDDFWAPYYASRGACLGVTPPAVVAAAFGVFNPAHIEEQLQVAWKAATPGQYWQARVEGATAQLERLLGPEPAGAAPGGGAFRGNAGGGPGGRGAVFPGVFAPAGAGAPPGGPWGR